MHRKHVLSFSDDGRYLFHSKPGIVRIWREQQFVREHPGNLVGHARDGRTFLTVDWKSQTISAWDSDSGTALNRSTIAPDSYAVNQRTLIRSERRTLVLYDALIEEPPRRLSFSDIDEHSVCDTWDLSADGTLLAVAFWVDIGGHDAAWGTCYALEGGDRFRTVFSFEVNRFTNSYVQFCDPHHLLVISDRQDALSAIKTTTGHRVKRFQFDMARGGAFLRFSPTDSGIAALHFSRDRWRLYHGNATRDIDEPALAAVFHPLSGQVVTVVETDALHVHSP